MGFFKSFFSGKPANPEEEKQKNNQKNFEIFKYDGMRAQRMGRADYAIKCFTEALALQEDFETMGYLAQVYIQSNELDEARKLLERMNRTEPEHTSTLLTLANYDIIFIRCLLIKTPDNLWCEGLALYGFKLLRLVCPMGI